jgi:hypothetical protein
VEVPVLATDPESPERELEEPDVAEPDPESELEDAAAEELPLSFLSFLSVLDEP